MDSGLRGFSAFLAGVVAAGVEAAGAVVVCAKAEHARKSSAIVAATARKEMVIMETPVALEQGIEPRAIMMNRG